MRQITPLIPPALLAMLAGCGAPASEYPSLAIRDVERVSGTMLPPETPAPPAPPAATTLSQLDSLAQQARAADAGFREALAPTRRQIAAAQGADPGSNAWSNAQVALANLEAQRSAAMIALADIDRLYVDASLAGQALERLESVRGEMSLLVAEQDAAIAALLAQLGR